MFCGTPYVSREWVALLISTLGRYRLGLARRALDTTITISYWNCFCFKIVRLLCTWYCFIEFYLRIKPAAPNCVSLAAPLATSALSIWHAPRYPITRMELPDLTFIFDCFLYSLRFFSVLDYFFLISQFLFQCVKNKHLLILQEQ